VIRDKLRLLTGLQFERVPSSGALDPKHGLKGDLYIPNQSNLYAIECKNYEEDHLTSKVLTSVDSQLHKFWAQAVRQGVQVNKKPLLLFKFTRSKIFVAYNEIPNNVDHVYISKGDFFVSMMEDWIRQEKPKFI
jgi:hypothetical protein